MARYVGKQMEKIISDALLRYAENRFFEEDDRQLALDYHYALQNDTSLVETTEEVFEGEFYSLGRRN